MSAQVIISVIVPIYNGEKFISKCLESLLKQTYKNFEILLIDDGSTDNTKLICLNYIKNKAPIIKYFYKTNGGTSSARNYGIEKARGEYISFIDQDDYVSKNHIKNFVENLNNHDWVMQGLINVTQNNKVLKIYQTDYRLECSKKDLVDQYLYQISAFDWVNNKIYKKHTILKNNIKFYTPRIINEDRVFNINYSFFVKNFLILPGYSYFWVENFYSQTHRYIHPIIFFREACVYDNFIYNKLIGKKMSKYSCKHAIRCFIHCIGLCIVSKRHRISLKERAKLIKKTFFTLLTSNSIKRFPFYSIKLIFKNIYIYIIKFFKFRNQKNFDLI